MYEYYDKYKKARTQGDADSQERWAHQLLWEVARHAVGEEIVVYPLMEKNLGSEGKKLADHDRDEHQVSVYLHCFLSFFRSKVILYPPINFKLISLNLFFFFPSL